MSDSHPTSLTNALLDEFEVLLGDLGQVNKRSLATYEGGRYGLLIIKPSKRLAAALAVDRELLVVATTFEDQQPRTATFAAQQLNNRVGRLDPLVSIVAHRDPRGNERLREWGAERGLTILPVYMGPDVREKSLERLLSLELYSHNPFDVTGPVREDAHFYGRQSESQDLARLLQRGQIRARLGIRRSGKTSVLNRVLDEMQQRHDCYVISVDASQDGVWQMGAAQLLRAFAIATRSARESRRRYAAVTDKIRERVDVGLSVKELQTEIAGLDKPLVVLFDEVDYLTPSSPTAADHWSGEFNTFWRNFRSVYHESIRSGKTVSVLVSGVTSKWFTVESVNGVENAAVSFVPEEYLSPLDRRASVRMIQKMGRVAGLVFPEASASSLAEATCDMPFWIRQACSFIHAQYDVDCRPIEIDKESVERHLLRFVESDGATLAKLALQHLFRVYGDLWDDFLRVADGKAHAARSSHLRALSKYGIINSRGKSIPVLSGMMITAGLSLLREEAHVEPSTSGSGVVLVSQDDSAYGGEWADELALIGKRRNVLERRLRSLIVDMLRFDALMDKGKDSPSRRILSAIPERRRESLACLQIDEAMERLYWLDLVQVVKREWSLFGRIFNDKALFDQHADIVNDRPDAHAKTLDAADVALHRRALSWIEDKVSA